MRKSVSYLIAFVLATLGARLVLGHGGTFPPGGTTGGSYTGPGDSTFGPGGPSGGPTSPGGPGAGDPDDGPATPPGGVRPPTTPGTRGGPGRGPTTGGLGRKSRSEPSIDRWERWWKLNRDAFLAEADPAAHSDTLVSATLSEATGPGSPTYLATDHRPTADDLHFNVAPTLLRLLRESHPIILDSAAIALGRSIAKEDSEATVAELHRLLRSSYPSVRQSAIIALGMLQHRSSIPILWGVMNDTQQGRQILGRTGPIQSVDRGFAALALGYVGDPSLAPILSRQIGSDDVETAAGAVLGLGLLGADDRKIITRLLETLRDDRIDPRVRAQVPISLGRMGDLAASTTPVLTSMLRDTRGHLDVRRSTAIALGRLASQADDEVIDALRDICRRERDGLLRHFSLLSLGRIGARIATPGRNGGAAAGDTRRNRLMREIAQFLAGEINDPSRTQDRPWAALAAGVFGRALGRGDVLRHELADDIRRWMKRSKNPSDESAAAISLGLLRDEHAAGLILERFRSRRDANSRAHLATALALLRDPTAKDDLRKALIEQRDPSLRVAAATALARIGDLDAAGELVDMLADAPTFAATAATARALGRIGDRRHLSALTDIALDVDQPEVVRGFACVALGMITEKTALPWNAPIAMDANFAIQLRAQLELLDIY